MTEPEIATDAKHEIPASDALYPTASSASARGTPGRVYGIGTALGESPIWVPEDAAVHCVDIVARRVLRVDLEAAQLSSFRVARRTTAIARTRNGTLVLASGDRIEFVDGSGRRLGGFRVDGWPPRDSIFNDAKCDRRGRLLIGTRHVDGRAGEGRLYRLDGASAPVLIDDGYAVPNGIAWSPAGDRLYVADSRRRVILRYRVSGASDEVTGPTVFVDLGASPARPDGLTVDQAGYVWCALWDGSAIRRYDPRGRLEREVQLPARRPTSCAFVGTSLDRLVVTSAADPLGDSRDLGGSLFLLDVGVTGVPEPAMA